MDFRGKNQRILARRAESSMEGNKAYNDAWIFQLERCCDNRKYRASPFSSAWNGLRGGEIGNFSGGLLDTVRERFQSVKQQQSQSCLACTDRNRTAPPRLLSFQPRILERLLVSDSDMLEQFSPSGVSVYSSWFGAYKQFTFQFIPPGDVHAAGDIPADCYLKSRQLLVKEHIGLQNKKTIISKRPCKPPVYFDVQNASAIRRICSVLG